MILMCIYFKCDQATDLWHHLELTSDCQITLVLLMLKMDGSVLDEKSSFKMLGLCFSSKLDWMCYIVSIAEIFPRKLEPKFVQ